MDTQLVVQEKGTKYRCVPHNCGSQKHYAMWEHKLNGYKLCDYVSMIFQRRAKITETEKTKTKTSVVLSGAEDWGRDVFGVVEVKSDFGASYVTIHLCQNS